MSKKSLTLSDMWERDGQYKADLLYIALGSIFIAIGAGILVAVGVAFIACTLYEKLVNLGEIDE